MVNDILTLAAEVADAKRNGCIITFEEVDGILRVRNAIHGERWQIYFMAACLIEIAAEKFGDSPVSIAKIIAEQFARGFFKNCEIPEVNHA